MSVTKLPAHPFRGLESFRYADQAIFSERSEETQQLNSLIRVYRGSLLYGQSGTGKSSLIAAGLIPNLKNCQPELIRVFPRKESTFVVSRIEFTENTGTFLPSVFEELCVGRDSKITVPFDSFKEIVSWKKQSPDKSMDNATSLLLIFDQFEELITLFEEAGKQEQETAELQTSIITLLRELYYDPSLNIKLLFVFREDYLAKFEKLFEAIPDLNDNFLRLNAIPDERIGNIVNCPFNKDKQLHPAETDRKYMAPFSPAMSQLLTEKLTAYFKGHVALTEVQIACLFLYKRPAERETWLEGDDAIANILRQFYIDILDQFSADEKESAIIILATLVLNERTRNIFHRDGVVEEYLESVQKKGNAAEMERCKNILHKLVEESRIVRKETRQDGDYYEIRSEAIIPFINEKKIERIRAAEYEEQRKRQEKEFEERRLAEQKSRKKKRRRIVLGALAAIVVAGLGILSAFNYQRYQLTSRIQQKEGLIKELEAEQLKAERIQLREQKRSDSLEIAQNRFMLEQKLLKSALMERERYAERIETEARIADEKAKIQAEKIKSESDNRLANANVIAKASMGIPSEELLEKTSLARLAYDLAAAADQQLSGFNPDIYAALSEALTDSFRVNTYYNDEFAKNYANIEGICRSNTNYYITRPFHSVVDKYGNTIYADTNLVHAWIDPGNTVLAVVTVPASGSKKLRFLRPGSATLLAEVALKDHEDVTSVIFDRKSGRCLFSTRFPIGLGTGCIYSLELQPGKKPQSFFSDLGMDDYAYLAVTASYDVIAMTNSGRYLSWESFTNSSPQSDKPRFITGGPVTDICYHEQSHSLFAGLQNGRIYRIRPYSKPELFSKDENSKVTGISASADGQWFAAGYITGRVRLWNLDSLQNEHAVLLGDNFKGYSSNYNSISGLCFGYGNNHLVAATRSGYVYLFPLKSDVMARIICDRKMIVDEERWKNSSIPKFIKYRPLCAPKK